MYPVLTTITNSIKSDVIDWGTAFMALALAVVAYHYIRRILEDREDSTGTFVDEDEAGIEGYDRYGAE